MEENFIEKLKNSFIKVREDMEKLRKEIDEAKILLFQKNNDILILKEQIKAQNQLISKLKSKIEDISTGNERVRLHTTSYDVLSNDAQKKLITPVTVEKFRHLTDREFSVFMAIYQLEEEKGAATYHDVSHRIGVNLNTTRNYINELINRGYPVYGERQFNRKTQFRIAKEFREQNMISEVLAFRELKNIKN